MPQARVFKLFRGYFVDLPSQWLGFFALENWIDP
jgi:hypothetical protein